MTLQELLAALQGNFRPLVGTGWNPDVQTSGIRPDYGLSTVTGIVGPAQSPYERTLAPGQTRSPSDLQDMLAEVILAGGAAAVPGVGPKNAARQSSMARPRPSVVLRPQGFRALGDEGVSALDSIRRPGHVYRGMESAEYEATVGKGGGVRSSGKYSHPSEGTNFASHPADAESYVNFGRSDPRTSGKDTYLVEAMQTPDMVVGRDGYIKSSGTTRPTRVWRMRPSDGAITMELVRNEE